MSFWIGSPDGAKEDSPGQRPGKLHHINSQALKGRDISPLQGSGLFSFGSQGAAPGYRLAPRWGFDLRAAPLAFAACAGLAFVAAGSVALAADSPAKPTGPRTPAEFVLQNTATDEKPKAFSGTAAERRARLADRAKGAYALTFDLSGLPAYAPKQKVAGTIRVWGNNYVGDSGLAARWREAFQRHHPDVQFELVLPTAAVAVPALSFGLADIGMNHEPTFYDLLSHVRVLGCAPTGFSVVTGSFDVSGWQNSFAIIVHKDNPLSQITLEQLDAVFGSARAGGWVGTRWEPAFARGPEKNIRTWDKLGLKGEFAGKRINPYGYSIRYATALEFSNHVLHGSDKWNEDILAFGNYISPEGKRTLQAEEIIARMRADRHGIAYIRWQPGFAEHVKVLKLAKDAAGPFHEFNVANVQARRYPLWGDQSFWVTLKPGEKLDARTAEFIRFVLSREGQELVMSDGKYLPLPADAALEQLAKLARCE